MSNRIPDNKSQSQIMMELVDIVADKHNCKVVAFMEGNDGMRDIYAKEEKESKAKLQAIADSIPVWISVEDRLPDRSKNEDEKYVMVTNGKDIFTGVCAHGTWVSALAQAEITHWICHKYLLPSPPVRKDDE